MMSLIERISAQARTDLDFEDLGRLDFAESLGRDFNNFGEEER